MEDSTVITPRNVNEPPFPWRAVLILLVCCITEPIVIAVLFPIAPFMVGEWVETDEVGMWAGLLASSYNVGSIGGSIFWGRLSDNKGRLPCIIGVQVGTALLLLLFGLSTSLSYALVMRFIGGLFSGMSGLVTAGIRPSHRLVSHPAS
jgi:MFS family permease